MHLHCTITTLEHIKPFFNIIKEGLLLLFVSICKGLRLHFPVVDRSRSRTTAKVSKNKEKTPVDFNTDFNTVWILIEKLELETFQFTVC